MATDISWSVDKATATFVGPTNQVEATVEFKNTKADWIKLKATFKVSGKSECAEMQIALVKVDVGAATFTKPGKPSGSNGGTWPFLVNPPAPPAMPMWVTTHDPGSNCGAFTYNGMNQAAEPGKFVDSDGAGGGPAYKASAMVTLTAPAEKKDALQHIEVGYIQHGHHSGSANYATTPAGGKRTITIPTTNSVDWLVEPCNPGATDKWPWYDSTAMRTGAGTTGSWNDTIELDDSPAMFIPAQYNPNDAADPNKTKAITTGSDTLAFVIRMAARTKDADLDANKHYFDHANSTWSVNFAWPVVAGTSIVTTGPAWTKPGSVSEIGVNVVPSITLAWPPFLRWIPSIPGSSGSSRSSSSSSSP